jgi:hypothetical protein
MKDDPYEQGGRRSVDIKDTAAETGESVFPDIAAATYAISQLKVDKPGDRIE